MQERDIKFMRLAIGEATEAYERKDFPVGAVLAIDNKLIGKSNNANYTQEDWNHHAETGVINRYSIVLKKARKEEKRVTLYTTLEPCIMCLGASIMNRVSRIVYACPDPNAGASNLDIKGLGNWYERHWPEIVSLDGIVREDSYKLLAAHMKDIGTWKEILEQFENMHRQWE
jgi:tRNA(adenine34) deaminase